LQATFRRLESFITLRFKIVDTADEELCSLFDLDFDSSRIQDAGQICPFELTVLLEAFHEFQQDLKNLHWFQRVNTEAVERILGKLERRQQTVAPSYLNIRAQWRDLRTRWDRDLPRRLHRYGSLIGDANGGLREHRRATGRSLFLERAFSGWNKWYADQVIQAIQSGNFKFVVKAFDPETTRFDVSPDELSDLFPEVLQYAAMVRPVQASALLVLDRYLLSEHHVLKWAILAMGRRQKMDSSKERFPHRQHHAAADFHPLRDFMEACTKEQLESQLAEEDSFGRLPVHYAAMYGATGYGDLSIEMFLPGDCEIQIDGSTDASDDSDESQEFGTESLAWKDIEGLTPIDFAAMADHAETLADVATLISLPVPGWVRRIAQDVVPFALLNAAKKSYQLLTQLKGMGAHGSTNSALVALAQAGHIGRAPFLSAPELCPDRLIRARGEFEVADRRGWTALFHACALGQYEIVKRLLELGCSQTRTDDLGWTAQEYAILNGHLAVAGLFELSDLSNWTDGPARVHGKSVKHPKVHCAEGERVIVATLGSERTNDAVAEVDLPCWSSPYSPGIYDGFSYSLEVSAPGTTEQPKVVRLPILDDQINDPFVFPIPATTEPQLVFRVIRLGAGSDSHGVLVGSGTALLEGNTKQFGAGRQSLIREQTIPILDKDTMGAVGTVTFTFMVANHFPHLQTPRDVHLARKVADPPALIGHRGLGMNLKTHEYLQIGENTVESFLSAAKLGASFVEFDFQVTKDKQAVIFHDFSLSQSGTDVPVHDVTLDQFMYAGNIQSPYGNPLSGLGPTHARDEPGARRKRKRSRSVGGHFEAGAIQIRDRMKHTADYELKGFKPNTRGDFIQDSFATLKELLIQVPEHVGFDIEISSSPHPSSALFRTYTLTNNG